MKRPIGYDPSMDSAILLGVGSAHAIEAAGEVRGKLAGHIVIPDVDERRGWREWYVYQPAPTPTVRRPLGFIKPESGQGIAEYALLLALVVIIAIASLTFLGGGLASLLDSIGQAV